MGSCFSLQRSKPPSTPTTPDLKVEKRMRSFSKRTELWERTGVIQAQSANLSAFPSELRRVPPKKVRIVDVSKNKIKKVPSYVGQMVYCNRLGLSSNRLQRLPPSIGLMESLRVLLLDSNRLEELPEELFMLPKLERLSLANNKLTKVPRSVGSLKTLKYLDVSGNRKLKNITSGIAGCKSLEELRCCDCAVQKLPVDCAKLEHLRLITAENNRIEAVASAIFLYCERLQTIALYGNPIDLHTVEKTKGYKEWEARRAAHWPDAAKKGPGVLLGSKAEDRGEEPRGASVLWSGDVGGKDKKTESDNDRRRDGRNKGEGKTDSSPPIGSPTTSSGVSRNVRKQGRAGGQVSPQVSSGAASRLKND